MKRNLFLIREDGQGHLLELRHPDDPYSMNWVEGETAWGTVQVPQWPGVYDGWGTPEKPYLLDVTAERTLLENGRMRERYIFTNNSDFEIDTLKNSVKIYTTFNDCYVSAQECKTRRCNSHIWCGGQVSYVMALRMGGEAPHLGLVLTCGSITGYSVERDVARGSNDRGDIILHPAPMRLAPGESSCIEWELFWFDGIEQFFDTLREYPSYIDVRGEQFIVFEGEQICLNSNAQPACIEEVACMYGEYRYYFQNASVQTHADVLVLPEFEALLQSRVHFIVEKQQCLDAASALYGAYLIYDNEEQRQYYSHMHDHNAGRERVGMGALVARYLRTHDDPGVARSLDLYLEFVLRELFDEESGTVYNDYRRCLDWHRIYNYSWIFQLFNETYLLKKDAVWLKRIVKAIQSFANAGGTGFYPIGLDVVTLLKCLEAEEMAEEAAYVRGFMRELSETLYLAGTDYPAQEVKYEQSIVYPALEVMLQAYEVFGEKKYLESAQEHLRLLKLFSGVQPDYHLNEVALRHWDGYWFGKEALLGDTLPHYWSVLTGNAFAHFATLTEDAKLKERAERALRGPLSMFRPDGSASCAMIYPETVNGRKAHLWDPWANDQDWAMYYYLKWHDGLDESQV